MLVIDENLVDISDGEVSNIEEDSDVCEYNVVLKDSGCDTTSEGVVSVEDASEIRVDLDVSSFRNVCDFVEDCVSTIDGIEGCTSPVREDA